MKKLFTLFLLFKCTITLCSAQDFVKMTRQFGSENKDIQDLISFENVYIEELRFEGESLECKYYKIDLEEFKNGKFVQSSTLFDGSESEFFRINSQKETLKFFFKLSDNKLKAYVRGKNYGSRKTYFKLKKDPEIYALKDFFGSHEEVEVDLQNRVVVFAIITPTIRKDGSGSYCDVVQSGVLPDKLGVHFNIPHYFLVSISFK